MRLALVCRVWRVMLSACGVALALAACGDGKVPAAMDGAPAAAVSESRALQGRVSGGAPAQPEAAPASPRHIAYTHRYAIEADRAKLRAVLDVHLARCKQIDCEVVNQSYEEENDNQPPRANLSVRVAHKDTAKFTEALKGGDSRVLRQSAAAEDKTLQVVDVEARITNLQQLRERYRKLLADPKAGIKDAVEIERALAQAQGELDSLAAQRRVLAQQTERELFEIGYQSRRGAIERNIFEPVKEALLNFGAVTMQSLGALISFIAASLVWIVALAVLWFGFRRWRRRNQRPA